MKMVCDIFKRIGGRVFLTVLAAAVLSVSCTDVESQTKGDIPGPETRVNIATRSGDPLPSESEINRVRVVIFGAFGSADRGRLLLNRYFPNVQDGEVQYIMTTSGLRDIYLIVNEPLDAFDVPLAAFTGIATVDDLKAIQLAYGGSANTTPGKEQWRPDDITMFESYINYRIKADGSSTIGAGIPRAISKATLNISYKLSDLSGDEVIFDGVCVRSLPRWSWLHPRSYVYYGGYDGTLIDSEMQKITGTKTGTGVDETFKSSNTFFLPEYILSDPDKFAYFEIYAHLKSDPSATFKYTAKIGDGINPIKSGSSRFDLTRNVHYTFNGRVVNYGDLQLALEIEADILPWNKYTLSTEHGNEYLSIKYNERFTHKDGGVIFLAKSMTATPELTLHIENREHFKVSGVKKYKLGEMYYTEIGIVPTYFVKDQVTSSVITAVIDGREMGRITVEADGAWRFTWATKTIDMCNGKTLRIMDRNIGATSPKSYSPLFLRGSMSGLGVNLRHDLVPISMWNLNSWQSGDYTINWITDWAQYHEYARAGSNCPEGWRLPTPEEMSYIVTLMQPYGAFPVDEYSESGYFIPAMDGGEIYFPCTGHFTIDGIYFTCSNKSSGTYLLESFPGQNRILEFNSYECGVRNVVEGVMAAVRCVQDGL